MARLTPGRPAGAGDVVLHETWKSCIAPEGHFNGVELGARDVVELQRGGTGFAAHDGDRVQASKFSQLGPGSGRADLRGQHKAARSLGGLVFRN